MPVQGKGTTMPTPREPLHQPSADGGWLLPLLSLGPLAFFMYVANLAILPGTVPVWHLTQPTYSWLTIPPQSWAWPYSTV